MLIKKYLRYIYKTISYALIALLTLVIVVFSAVFILFNSASAFNKTLDVFASTSGLWGKVSAISFSLIDLSLTIEDLVIFNTIKKNNAAIKAELIDFQIGYQILAENRSIDSVTITGLKVDLQKNKQGEFLWSLLNSSATNKNQPKRLPPPPSPQKPTTSANTPASEKTSFNKSFAIKSLIINNVDFKYHDLANDLNFALLDLSVKTLDWSLLNPTPIEFKTHIKSAKADNFWLESELGIITNLWFTKNTDQFNLDLIAKITGVKANFLTNQLPDSQIKLNLTQNFANNDFNLNEITLNIGDENSLSLGGEYLKNKRLNQATGWFNLKSTGINQLLSLFKVKVDIPIIPQIDGSFEYNIKEGNFKLNESSIGLNQNLFLVKGKIDGLMGSAIPEFSFNITGADDNNFPNNTDKLNLRYTKTKLGMRLDSSAVGNFENFNFDIDKIKFDPVEVSFFSQQKIQDGALESNFNLNLKIDDLAKLLTSFGGPKLDLIKKINLVLFAKLNSADRSFALNKFDLLIDDYLLTGKAKINDWQNFKKISAKFAIKDNQSKQILANLTAAGNSDILNINFELDGFDMNANLAAKANNWLDKEKLAYWAKLNYSVKNLRQTLAKLEVISPTQNIPDSLTFDSSLAGTSAQFKLDKAKINYGITSIGLQNVLVNWIDEKTLTGTLLVDRLSFDQFSDNEKDSNEDITPSNKSTYELESPLLTEKVEKFLHDYKINLRTSFSDTKIGGYNLPLLKASLHNEGQEKSLKMGLGIYLYEKKNSNVSLISQININKPYRIKSDLTFFDVDFSKLNLANNQLSLTGVVAGKTKFRASGNKLRELLKSIELNSTLKITNFTSTKGSVEDNFNDNFMRAKLDLLTSLKNGKFVMSCLNCGYQDSRVSFFTPKFKVAGSSFEWLNDNFILKEITLKKSQLSLRSYPTKNTAAPEIKTEKSLAGIMESLSASIKSINQLPDNLNKYRQIDFVLSSLPNFGIEQLNFGGLSVWQTQSDSLGFSSVKVAPFSWSNIGFNKDASLNFSVTQSQGVLDNPLTPQDPQKHIFESLFSSVPDKSYLINYTGLFKIDQFKNSIHLGQQRLSLAKSSDGKTNYQPVASLGLDAKVSLQNGLNVDGEMMLDIKDLYKHTPQPSGAGKLDEPDNKNKDAFPIKLFAKLKIDNQGINFNTQKFNFGEADLKLISFYKPTTPKTAAIAKNISNARASELNFSIQSENLDASIKKLLASYQIDLPATNVLNPFLMDANLLLGGVDPDLVTLKSNLHLADSFVKTKVTLNAQKKKYTLASHINQINLDKWRPNKPVTDDDTVDATVDSTTDAPVENHNINGNEDENKDGDKDSDPTINDTVTNFLDKLASKNKLLPLAIIRDYKVSAKLALDSLISHKQEIKDISLNITSKDGLIILDKFNFLQVGGGKQIATGKIDARLNNPIWNLSYRLNELDLLKLNVLATGNPDIEGKLNALIMVNSLGNSMVNHRNNLRGELKIKLSPLVLKRVSEVDYFACLAVSALRASLFSKFKEDALIDSEINNIEMNLAWKNGNLLLGKMLNLNLEPLEVASNGGFFDLVNGDLEFDAMIKFKGSKKHPSCQAPLFNQVSEVRLSCLGNLQEEKPLDICKINKDDTIFLISSITQSLLNPLEWGHRVWLFFSD
ncbi:MAG: hypothetical protein JJV97_05150 [SAR324 cluster bacterium]|nr:hypothetical protein [SAR324 cluster bacterium]